MSVRRLSGLVDHRFSSASELEALLASIGFAAQVLQLEGGVLQGAFSVPLKPTHGVIASAKQSWCFDWVSAQR